MHDGHADARASLRVLNQPNLTVVEPSAGFTACLDTYTCSCITCRLERAERVMRGAAARKAA